MVEEGIKMKFTVTRTSQCNPDIQPVKGAKPPTRVHRNWVIEIADLDALMTFVGNYGDVIISETKHIEIYDNYRE